MRRFPVILNEWYEKDKNDNSDIGHNIGKWTFEQNEGEQKTIKDLKNWLLWKGFENNQDLCPCFIKIHKYSCYNNLTNRDILKECVEYNNNTLLNSTIFNENNIMYASFDKSRNCTCGKIQDLKGMQNIFSKKLEEEKKNLQDDFNKKTNESAKQYEDKLKQVTNEFKNKIQQQKQLNIELEKKMYRQNDEHEEQIKKIKRINDEENKKNKEKIQILDQSLKEIDAKEKTFIQNKISAENKYNSSYQDIFSKYYKDKKDILAKEILEKMQSFLLNKLSFDDLVEEIIPAIAKKEKFSKYMKEFIEEKISSLKDENLDFKISHFNILIMGNTGVGKSTLLNRVLKEKLAETNFGDACTQGKPKAYESKNAKGIRIWDTKGIEQGDYNINAAHLDIEEAINNLVEEKDPDKFIHCIWYCVHSNRFLKEEINNIKKCYNFYNKNLPIIIVYTQSDNQDEANKMISYIKIEIESIKNDENENSIKILKVLAEDKVTDNGTIKAFGISNLMKETSEAVKFGIESSCTESLIKLAEKMLKIEFDENINDLKQYFFNENLEMNFPNLSDKEQFNIINGIIIKDDDSIGLFESLDFSNFTKFVSNFSKKLAETLIHKDKLNKQSLIDLLNIMTTKVNDIKNHFEEIFEKKLGDISIELADEIDNLTHEIDSTYNISYLSSKYGHNTLKLQSRNNIINNLKPIIEDNIYREISKSLYDIYAEKFSNKMLEIFHDLIYGDKSNKKLINMFFDKGQETAEKIHSKIVKLLDYPNDDFVEKKKKGKNIKEILFEKRKNANDKNKQKVEDEEEEEEEEEEKDEENNEDNKKRNNNKDKERKPHNSKK